MALKRSWCPSPRPLLLRAHRLYTIRRGDTLVSIADRFGVSLTQFRRWNKLPATGIKIPAGHRLHVAEPPWSAPAAATVTTERERPAAQPTRLPPLLTALGRRQATRPTPATPHRRKTQTAPLPRSTLRIRSHPRKHKNNRRPFLFACFDSFSISVVVRMTPHAEIIFCRKAEMQTPKWAAVIRWRQSDGRCDQDVRNE